MSVQLGVMTTLSEVAGISKIGMNKAGEAVAAPIFAGNQALNGQSIQIPACGVSGLEVEIALRLGRDLTPEIAAGGEAAILSAIDSFYLGVELLGSRLARPKEVGFNTFLADNLGNAGYVLQTDRLWSSGADVEGKLVNVQIDGQSVFSGAAKHPFGGILIALQHYALAPNDLYGCCRADHIITTGTLCGVVPISSSSTVRVSVGDDAELEFFTCV